MPASWPVNGRLWAERVVPNGGQVGAWPWICGYFSELITRERLAAVQGFPARL